MRKVHFLFLILSFFIVAVGITCNIVCKYNILQPSQATIRVTTLSPCSSISLHLWADLPFFLLPFKAAKASIQLLLHMLTCCIRSWLHKFSPFPAVFVAFVGFLFGIAASISTRWQSNIGSGEILCWRWNVEWTLGKYCLILKKIHNIYEFVCVIFHFCGKNFEWKLIEAPFDFWTQTTKTVECVLMYNPYHIQIHIDTVHM